MDISTVIFMRMKISTNSYPNHTKHNCSGKGKIWGIQYKKEHNDQQVLKITSGF